MINFSPLQRSGVSKGIPREIRYKNGIRAAQYAAPIRSFSIDAQPSRLMNEASMPIRGSTNYISTEGGTSKQKDNVLIPMSVDEALKEKLLMKNLQRTTVAPKSYHYKESLHTNMIEKNIEGPKQIELSPSIDENENESQIRVPVPIMVQENVNVLQFEKDNQENVASSSHTPKFTVMQTTPTPLRQAIGAVQHFLPPAAPTGLGNFMFPQGLGNLQNQGSFGNTYNNLDVKTVSGITIQSTPPPSQSSNPQVSVKTDQSPIISLQGIQQLNLPQLSSSPSIMSTQSPTIIQYTTPSMTNGNIEIMKHAQETMEAAIKANQIRPGTEKYEQKGCVWDIVSNSCKDIFNLKWCDKCEDFGNIFMHDCKCTISHIESNINRQVSMLQQQTPQQYQGITDNSQNNIPMGVMNMNNNNNNNNNNIPAPTYTPIIQQVSSLDRIQRQQPPPLINNQRYFTLL
uniref:Nuclear receptor domain-containing protein n=1 Tax=Parastrongyloides trichosuri TaxID=131310 RepID=A0A0N4Z4A8_PARTI